MSFEELQAKPAFIVRQCVKCGRDFNTREGTSQRSCPGGCAKRGTVAERLAKKTDRNGPTVRPELGPCWDWTGAADKHGYGRIGVGTSSSQLALTHRVAWELENGAIPEGLDILHSCDRSSCIRPSHLHPGTHQQNMQESVKRDRSARGSRCPRAKLTEEQVLEIMRLESEGERCATLAEKFGVSKAAISQVVHRVRWRHVTAALPQRLVDESSPAIKDPRNRQAKALDAEAVLDIRARWKAGESTSRLAERYGVTTSTISNTVNGKRWGQLPVEETEPFIGPIQIVTRECELCGRAFAIRATLRHTRCRGGCARRHLAATKARTKAEAGAARALATAQRLAAKAAALATE